MEWYGTAIANFGTEKQSTGIQVGGTHTLGLCAVRHRYYTRQYERAIHLDAHQMSDIYQVILGNKVANLGKSYV